MTRRSPQRPVRATACPAHSAPRRNAKFRRAGHDAARPVHAAVAPRSCGRPSALERRRKRGTAALDFLDTRPKPAVKHAPYASVTVTAALGILSAQIE